VVIALKDVLRMDGKPHDCSSFVPRVFEAAMGAWQSGVGTVILDDLDFISGQKTIYSNRFTSTSESRGFNRTSAEPTTLLKALADFAVEHGKNLLFSSTEDHFLRFMGLPYAVHMKAFKAEDYTFFMRSWLGDEGMESLDAVAVFNRFPALTPAELRVACIPHMDAAGAHIDLSPAYAASIRRENKLTTENMVENIGTNLGESHGALPLSKVEKVDLNQMPGLGDVLETLETQVRAYITNKSPLCIFISDMVSICRGIWTRCTCHLGDCSF